WFPEIYTMNASGGDLRDISLDRDTWYYNPAWSPDGEWIAFESNGVGGTLDIFVMDADGNNLRNVTNPPGLDLDPAWSRDGKRIAYSGSGERFQDVYVIDVDGDNMRRLTDTLFGESNPTWSP
ncbi:MAG: hypothetical protein O3A46_10550, partial [Candidatus Poribacteria bacterium]|nr:hypothetical protein [Candidatus Poribacteria bacterium]